MMTREQMLRRLSAVQFALWETHVYLDTHQGDENAKEMHKSYMEKYQVMKKEYEELYGPLTLSGYNSDEWLKDPWPWDLDKGDNLNVEL